MAKTPPLISDNTCQEAMYWIAQAEYECRENAQTKLESEIAETLHFAYVALARYSEYMEKLEIGR